MNKMDRDLVYGSGLLETLSNVNKMKLLDIYIDELSDDILDSEVKKLLKENAKSGDDVLFATSFHDQKEPQKGIIVSLLKALRQSDSIEELRTLMGNKLNSIGSANK